MRSSRLRLWVQAMAIIAVAVPAVGIASLSLREGVLESGGPSVNSAFHLILGATSVLLLADFWVAIRRTAGVRMSLALGLGGVMACFLGAVLSEVLGPPALAILLAGAAAWGIALIRSGSGKRAELALRADGQNR